MLWTALEVGIRVRYIIDPEPEPGEKLVPPLQY